jgi:hypothetical protein
MCVPVVSGNGDVTALIIPSEPQDDPSSLSTDGLFGEQSDGYARIMCLERTRIPKASLARQGSTTT